MNVTAGKRLFLIDGMHSLYRAHFAVRGLSNSRGLPTNAIFGFTSMLRKLIRDHHPEFLGVVMDSKEPTFRQEKLASYKAHRPPMPDELVAQLPYIDRLCEALRIPVIRLPKYEADDILGTLARQASGTGVQTILVTNDKDLSQLVHDPEVVMLSVIKSKESKGDGKGEAKEVFLDEAGVRARYGVGPEKIVDWLALMGDGADGFTGGVGIGPKGAVQLLEEFGDIESAIAGWERVKRKNYREALQNHAEQIRLAQELAQIDLDVPVTLDLEALKYEEPDYQLAHQLFAELEFNQLSREFAKGMAKSVEPERVESTITSEYLVHETNGAIEEATARLGGLGRLAFILTTEPGGPGGPGGKDEKGGALTGISISSEPGRGEHFALDRCEDRAAALKRVAELLENEHIEKATHDWKRALNILENEGIHLRNVVDDTLLEGYLLSADAKDYDLPLLATTFLNETSPHLPPLMENAANQSARFADLTGRLAVELRERLAADRPGFPYQQQSLDYVYREIELPLVPLLYQIERAGFRIDPAALGRLSIELESEIERLTKEIYREAGREFNIASPMQLGEIFEQLNYEVSKRTSTGKIATGRDVLDELAIRYTLPRLVIEHRELSKLKGTYVDALPALIDPTDGRIHTTLKQTIAATGRLSSTDPNLQNIPIRTEMGRRIRRAFIPADGCLLLSADYSQIELRLLAHVTRDPVMLEAFRLGEDIHERTARAVFRARTPEELREKRRVAKIVNFGIAYVIGPWGLAQRVGISRYEARKVIDDYYQTYAGVKRYMDELPEMARQADCTVRSIFGRLRRLPDLNGKGASRAGAEREAINMPMQGSASDIVKLAMLRVDEALQREKLKARMILQIHDELVFEVPREEVGRTAEVVKETMEHVAEIDVPLPVEIGIGENWMDAKP